jgi:predicted amidohydrolase
VRLLALAGADLVAVPTALMDSFKVVVRTIVPARAAENQVFLAYANRCGREGDLRTAWWVVPRAEIGRIAERLEMVAALEAEMHAKVGAGEIRSLLERMPGLRDQIIYID